MTNDEVERAIEFLLNWQAEFNLKLESLVDKVDGLADKVDRLVDKVDRFADSTERITKATEELLGDRQRILQLIELQSSRLDRQDSWWKDHEDRIRRIESES